MTDIFDVLAQDHQEVKRMLAELEKGPGKASGASDDELLLRKKMAEELVIEESRHESAEESYFWPTVRQELPDGDRLADEATGQEQDAKEILDKLDKADASDPEFEPLLATFTTAARQHIEFEEDEVWPALRAALTKEMADELGVKVAEAKKAAPTRPHPHVPASPIVQKTAGPAAAVADVARDAATGRGSG